MRYNALLGMALAAVAGFGVIGGTPVNVQASDRLAVMPQMPVIAKTARKPRKTTSFRSNGKREVARRLRQIAAGQLTRSNGLVTAAELYGKAIAA
jgi:hypothetical protein